MARAGVLHWDTDAVQRRAGRASLPEASHRQRKMVIWPLIDGAQTAFRTRVFGRFQQLQGLLCMLLQRVAWIG